MKIIIAPDSFKESLTAMQVAQAIEKGFQQVFSSAEYLKLPMADGGEGTVQSMVDATQGEIVEVEVTGPLGDKVLAHYGILGGSDRAEKAVAVIEMASASGLHLVPRAQRDPYVTTSYGTGELIKDVLDRGIEHIILGLGGSATNDAGLGMAQALGIRLLDVSGHPLGAGGLALMDLETVDLSQCHPKLAHCQIEVACDVTNPLCGENGASAIFGPQKGATQDMINKLDAALGHFADVMTKSGFLDQRDVPGVGAAGGMGFAMKSLLNAELKPGIAIVMQAVNFAQQLQGADLVITGEGRIDGQTVFGKTPMGVLTQANLAKVPCIAIAGCFGDGAQAILEQGMKAIFPIIPGLAELDQVLSEAEQNLTFTARNIAASMALAQQLNAQ
ncbi:glycerate kinase [Marinomonas sp. THO17]|uniref:glycerate kinase n=1 Tax=Marinomonas sp. THO17 TaxID=3149048 RepID=UPI00336C281D